MTMPSTITMIGICLSIATLTAPPSFAQEASLPQDVRQALNAQADELAPITAAWDWTLSKGGQREVQNRQRIVWADGSFRLRTTSVFPHANQTENSYDGTTYFVGGADRSSLLKSAIPSGQEQPLIYLQYFENAGVLLPATGGDIAGKVIQSKLIQLLRRGAVLSRMETAQLENKQLLCVQILADNEYRANSAKSKLSDVERSARTWAKTEAEIKNTVDTVRRMQEMPARLKYSFYLDPNMGYAVRRYDVSYEDGTLLRQCNNREFEQLKGRGLWLPRECQVDHYWSIRAPEGFRFSTSPIHSEFIKVTELVPAVLKDENFALNYTKPGTYVMDKTNPENTQLYMIPASLESLSVGPWYRQPRSMVLLINAIGVLVLALYVVRRRLRRRSA
jgi:hypothetical protein